MGMPQYFDLEKERKNEDFLRYHPLQTGRILVALTKRHRGLRSFFLWAALIFLAQAGSFIPVACGDTFSDFGVIRPKEGKTAPSFSLKDLEGRTVSLEDFRGKVVLLSFWATWCVPCTTEMPGMKKLIRSFQGKYFSLLAVSIDKGDPRRLQSFATGTDLNFPILIDRDQTVRKKYFISALPSSYLIGRDGKFLGFISGQRDWASEEAFRLVSGLIRGKASGSNRPTVPPPSCPCPPREQGAKK